MPNTTDGVQTSACVCFEVCDINWEMHKAAELKILAYRYVGLELFFQQLAYALFKLSIHLIQVLYKRLSYRTAQPYKKVLWPRDVKEHMDIRFFGHVFRNITSFWSMPSVIYCVNHICPAVTPDSHWDLKLLWPSMGLTCHGRAGDAKMMVEIEN